MRPSCEILLREYPWRYFYRKKPKIWKRSPKTQVDKRQNKEKGNLRKTSHEKLTVDNLKLMTPLNPLRPVMLKSFGILKRKQNWRGAREKNFDNYRKSAKTISKSNVIIEKINLIIIQLILYLNHVKIFRISKI